MEPDDAMASEDEDKKKKKERKGTTTPEATGRHTQLDAVDRILALQHTPNFVFDDDGIPTFDLETTSSTASSARESEARSWRQLSFGPDPGCDALVIVFTFGSALSVFSANISASLLEICAPRAKGDWGCALLALSGNSAMGGVYFRVVSFSIAFVAAQEVIKKLAAAGFKAHSLDRMLFSVQDDNGELLCLVLVYVDDFLMCFHKRYDISVLKEMFEWGEWTRVRNGIKFKGKELALVQQPNGEYCVKVTQTAFIKNSTVGKLTQERSQGAPALTTDIAAGVSFANKGTETTTEDLKNLYKLMSYAKATDDVGLLIRPIPLNRLDRCVLLDWKTTHTPRVVRSTVVGEVYAADDAIDRAYHTNCEMTEIITGEPAIRTGPKLLHVHATDCRNLFDAVISANPSTEEKRVLIAVSGMVLVGTYRLMVADVSTKDSDALRWGREAAGLQGHEWECESCAPLVAVGVPLSVGASFAWPCADNPLQVMSETTGVELSFQRASVHLVHDVKRLEDGEDLNDALLDFFVKLGQALIPNGRQETGFNAGLSPVAYLGSYFYGMLQKGHASDGRAGHANVANWAKRRLGKGGLFADQVGAFAVPVNELLRDYMGRQQEKHWWLAVLVNPRGGCPSQGPVQEGVSVACLDSFARTGMRYKPPRRALKDGTIEAYSVEISSFSRSGFVALVGFRAQGDGSLGPLVDPRLSRLQFGHRIIKDPELDLKVRNYGDFGVPGVLEGTLEFAFDSSTRICGDYMLHYGGVAEYKPALKLELRREPNQSQQQVSRLLGGYCAKEWELANPETPYKDSLIAGALQLADTPQQESAHDCGFFILEQVLRLLQLSPTALRSLAQRSTEDVAGLPWPAQREVVKRKKKLREVTADLFVAARRQGTGDVEVLLKQDEVLRKKLLLAMWEGPYFAKAVANLIGMDPGPLPEIPTLPKEEAKKHEAEEESESDSSERSSSSHRSSSSASSSHSRKRKHAESRSRSRKRARKERKEERHTHRAERPARPPPPPSFTKEDLQGYPSKTLRNLCVQYKVLPPGMVERTDLLKALERLAIVKNAVPAGTAAAAKAVGERLAGAARPDLPSFTTDDLDTMPISKLKMFCIQFGRLPSGSLEKSDLKKALAPLAKPSTKPKQAFSGNGTASGHSHSHHHHKKRALPSFTATELDTMPISRLKSYCIQYGKMPHGPVERTDLVALLKPFAAAAGASSAPGSLGPGSATTAATSFGSQASSAKPAEADSFVLEDLKTMSMKVLKTFCLKHKVMPHGPVEKCDLQKALEPFARKCGCAGSSRVFGSRIAMSHHYDGHKTICTPEDKGVAGRLGGHTWNILTNSDKHELYLTQARSRDHYINDKGEITSVWFDRRRRVPHSVRGLEGANWSANVKESLLCPGTPPKPGPPSKAPRNQLLQASAPRDFALYTARRREVVPPTPEHSGHLDRTLGTDQARLRDSWTPRAPKVVDRKEWTPRRGEARMELKPPKEEEMFSSVGQLRAESHIDVQQGSFAQQLGSSRESCDISGAWKVVDISGSGLPSALFSHRSSVGTPRLPEQRVNHSQSRMEGFSQREISNWALGDDKLLRKDPFCMRPMQQPNNSGVKYDIITNERSKFWY
eukprot:s315_g16.t1